MANKAPAYTPSKREAAALKAAYAAYRYGRK